MSQPFRPDSSEKWWYNNKNTVFNIYCVASRQPIFSFFSFLDSIISGHVTQISDFLRYRKIKVSDFSEVAKFWKVLINFHRVIIITRFYANYLRPCLNMLEKILRCINRFNVQKMLRLELGEFAINKYLSAQTLQTVKTWNKFSFKLCSEFQYWVGIDIIFA